MLDALPAMATNLLSPMALFFALGLAAGLLRSDLSVPREVTLGLALYLMMAIGFRGGAELAHSGLSGEALGAASAAVALGLVIPCLAYAILRRVGRLGPADAGAVAAHYGSISAVTFVTATGFLTSLGVPYGGYMVAVMALMEVPGIATALTLARLGAAREGHGDGEAAASDLGATLREALSAGSVVLLLGSFAVGLVTGERGLGMLGPFVLDIFPGALCLFLLDMGLTAAQRLHEFLHLGRFLLAFGIAMPVLGGTLGALAGWLVGLGPGEATLLATLAGSASYIAAPAAVRIALPQANASLAITLSLGVTFPFNVLAGIPLYYALARALVGG